MPVTTEARAGNSLRRIWKVIVAKCCEIGYSYAERWGKTAGLVLHFFAWNHKNQSVPGEKCCSEYAYTAPCRVFPGLRRAEYATVLKDYVYAHRT